VLSGNILFEKICCETKKNTKKILSKMAIFNGKNDNILNPHISETTYVRLNKFGTNN